MLTNLAIYSYFVLQNMLSKTADQQNHRPSAGLDFDMYPVLQHFGKGMTILAFSCFDWISTSLLRDFWFLLWIDDQVVSCRNNPQILLLPLCFIRVYFEIMECFDEEVLEGNCVN